MAKQSNRPNSSSSSKNIGEYFIISEEEKNECFKGETG